LDPLVGADIPESLAAAGEVDDTVGLVAWFELDDEQAAAMSVRPTAMMPSSFVDRDRDGRMARSWRADVSNS
jgi:hypothetical protein